MGKVLLKTILAATISLMMLISVPGQAEPKREMAISGSVAAIDTGRAGMPDRAVSDAIPTPTNDPQHTYHIGVGDIVRIEIGNIPGPPRYARVLSDGRLDYSLGGTELIVAGKTAAEAERCVAASIKIIKNARVSLTVSDFSSHTVSFWGLVDQPGDHEIQRDAVPFYVIRAMAEVDPRARWARITRGGSTRSVTIPLSESSFDQLLVYPGDSIEFTDSDIVDK